MAHYVFVTGHHRAGTHEFAEYLGKQTGLPYVMEDLYMFNSMEILDLLLQGKIRGRTKEGKLANRYIPALVEKGFILQCPGLACFIPRLAELGDVYWCYRNPEHIATSMANGGFNDMLWGIMKSFRSAYPDDPIWTTLKYKDREDPHAGFIGYAFLLTKVKEYFYHRYFEGLVKKRVVLEDQPYYIFENTITAKRPAKQNMIKRLEKVKKDNEALCVD